MSRRVTTRRRSAPGRRVRARASRWRPTAPTAAPAIRSGGLRRRCWRPPAGWGRRGSESGRARRRPARLDRGGARRSPMPRGGGSESRRIRDRGGAGVPRRDAHRDPGVGAGAAGGRGLARTYWQPPQGAAGRRRAGGLQQVLPRLAALHVFSWWPRAERRPLAARADLWRRASGWPARARRTSTRCSSSCPATTPPRWCARRGRWASLARRRA